MELQVWAAICLLLFTPGVDGQQDNGCQLQCGHEAQCVNGNCSCSAGLSLHPNGRDCKNETCAARDCLTCSEAGTCIRCVKFIVSSDASCVERCSGEAEVRSEGPLQGNVCIPEKDETDNSKLIIGIVGGIGAGLVLCFLVILIVCIYIRRTRKKVRLQGQQYKSPNMEMGNIKQYPAYDNQAYVNELNGDIKTGVVDPAVYSIQLEQLRPHTETLMTLLAQIRPKLRAMDPADPRIPTYKGVIHQLCRVLVLLHRKDSGTSIPSDALGLMEWAQQMLEDHRQQQQELQQDRTSPDVLSDLGHTKISYIDVDMDVERLQAPAVYAEPLGSATQSLRSASGVSPYSSVPVPLLPDSTSVPRTFATIHRTPSVPGTVNNNSKAGYARPAVSRQITETRKPRPKSMGYFANGRYYDPNPRLEIDPNPMPQTEIYAPASSYSDRSTAPLSTFIPDRPRSRSLSSTEASSEGGEMVDGDEDSDGDMFPFDPKDATEPVEV